ncbi:hypothetical protein [Chthonobacter rhizosphaerae]|uniref:hypothetical protein n=1 Tax=Chthonobacter rhizosphaerae TaxID=2735553 RepID=UPI0015EF3E4B|nr:hypothetical protein [Chthonobacter rhizosphaerae]
MFIHGGRNETLWPLIGPPAVWAIHFTASYVWAAIACAKTTHEDAIYLTARIGIGVMTVLALAAIAYASYHAWRVWGFGRYEPPHADDTEEDRRRFLGYATLLLAALSAVSVIFVALPAAFIPECTW